MDIRNVGSQPGNVDRTSERGNRAKLEREQAKAPTVAVRDDARISDTGRETAAAVDALAEKARGDGQDREQTVRVAVAKLVSGELDSPEVLRETANKLFDGGFGSV